MTIRMMTMTIRMMTMMIVMINFLNKSTYKALDSRRENSNANEKNVNFRAETYERTANIFA